LSFIFSKNLQKWQSNFSFGWVWLYYNIKVRLETSKSHIALTLSTTCTTTQWTCQKWINDVWICGATAVLKCPVTGHKLHCLFWLLATASEREYLTFKTIKTVQISLLQNFQPFVDTLVIKLKSLIIKSHSWKNTVGTLNGASYSPLQVSKGENL